MVYKISRHLRDLVQEKPKGSSINTCYQCGRCTGVCPISHIDTKFNPRRIILDTLLGGNEQLLTQDTLWKCTLCYSCEEYCPEEVHITTIIQYLRNQAAKKGNIPDGLLEELRNLEKSGVVLPISEGLLRRRDKLHLSRPKTPPLNEIVKILQRTGLSRLTKSEEED